MSWRARHGSRRANAPLRVSDGRPRRNFGTTHTPCRSDSSVLAALYEESTAMSSGRVPAADDQHPLAGQLARIAVVVAVQLGDPGRDRRHRVGEPGHAVVARGDDDRAGGDLDVAVGTGGPHPESAVGRPTDRGHRVTGPDRRTQIEPVGVIAQIPRHLVQARVRGPVRRHREVSELGAGPAGVEVQCPIGRRSGCAEVPQATGPLGGVEADRRKTLVSQRLQGGQPAGPAPITTVGDPNTIRALPKTRLVR